MVRWVVLHAVPYIYQDEFIFGEHPKMPYNQICLVLAVKQKGGSVIVLGRIIVVFCCLILTLHGRITAKEYVDKLDNQVHPMIQTIFFKNDAVFQDDTAPIHIAGALPSWFEEHEGELQHLPCPAQSPD
jgi:hypothetical protein